MCANILMYITVEVTTNLSIKVFVQTVKIRMLAHMLAQSSEL